ncbi:PPE domain-containing protein [Mycobacterium ulcerans]|uniref:PPE family protein n=1 Tax=Mycobacterium ulcerans TaxID=1809 RepID=UPI0012DDC2D6|nr:PPE family protein [Mycobacterium ulcerans]MEB3971054.1 PPE domain-containing protein [Mycobacterium ulcerans]MEB3979311.1 PPE domain-containing protein [Mycobacterium ulcerans]MEB4008592.1 PPE domain-containing protein [Mycobacterium ulcerans]MEB4418170.1 PPE domain-containing protein [Mycobacterium ulcerans]MEB4436328.1 PPE domain-containing protein [Mycobacterium ulcerans]
MTSPLWMASPPEVHSSLLSTGPGPGGILVAAAGWLSLGALFEATAAEVDHQICEAIRLWQGRAADDYVAAHTPYVVWLDHAAIVCQRAGAALQMMVAAYGDALAEMPTMAELQENHAVHGVLVATNFFGLNGVPIAVNEADYVRMWIQAAGVMGVYESCTSAALLEVPPTCPSPVLVNPGVEGVGNATSWSGFADSDEFSVSSFNDGVLGLDVAVAGELCEFDPFDGLDLDGCQLVSVSTTQGFGAAMDVTAAPGSPLSGAALAPTGHICAGVPLATSTPLGVTRHVGDLQMMAARDNSDRAVVDAPHEILVSDSRGGTAQSGASGSVRPGVGSASVVQAASPGRPVSELAGGRGAGTVGFAGVSATGTKVRPAGLSATGGGEFGSGAGVPVLPATWPLQVVGSTSGSGVSPPAL